MRSATTTHRTSRRRILSPPDACSGADAWNNIVAGWQYTPYQVCANSIFGRTTGRAYVDRSDLNEELLAWKDALVDHGTEQGLTLNQ